MYELLARPNASAPPRAIVLVGLRVVGGLNLEAAELHAPLIAHGCWFDEPVTLCGATAPEIRLTACRIPGLAGDRVETRGDFDLSTSRLGVVSLQRAHIGGSMLLAGTELADGDVPIALGDCTLRPTESVAPATSGVSLMAPGARIDGDLLCTDGFHARGLVELSRARVTGTFRSVDAVFDGDLIAEGIVVEGDLQWEQNFHATRSVLLTGARISQQLSLEGARMQRLDADGLRVDGDMLLRERFRCEERISLLGGSVTGELSFDGATLVGGLLGDQLHVGDRLSFTRDFSASGEVRLCGVRVGGQLSMIDARLENGHGLALDLEGARIDHDLILRFAAPPVGGIDLSDARAERLGDSEATWPPLLRLENCAFGLVHASEDREGHRSPAVGWRRLWLNARRPWLSTPDDVSRRLRWIRLAEKVDDYSPRPYTHLVDLYRRQGRELDARRVAYERERRRASRLKLVRRTWNAFLRWTVGYGYRPMRAVGLLGVLVVVGTIVFGSFHAQGDLRATRADHPQFIAGIYTLDRLLPVVSFGLRDAYVPHAAAQWWAFAFTLLGWALTVAVLAGLNAAVRRE